MASSTFRIERRGSQLNIEVLNGTGAGSTLSLQVPSEPVVAALFEALDLKLSVSAGGMVSAQTDEVDDCSNAEAPHVSAPLDELVETMVAAVLKAADAEDASALESTLRRLERASLCVKTALESVGKP